jgi:enoyl-CoA hydratase/carnithine racemase
MDYQFIKITRQARILIVQINRPDDRNALCAGLIRELIDVTDPIKKDMSASVVLLVGQDQFFSAGVDLKDPENARVFQEPLSVRRRLLLELGPRMCQVWQDLPQVTMVALEGFCIGGAVSLALACDFRIMSDTAFLQIPEINLGMNYSWGSLPRLVNLVGPAKAKQWVILAQKVDCREALQAGFAQWAVPDGTSLQKALELAGTIAEKPQAPVFMTKQTVNALLPAPQAVGHMDADQFALTLTSEDFQEGVEAFLNKRKPNFNKTLPE